MWLYFTFKDDLSSLPPNPILKPGTIGYIFVIRFAMLDQTYIARLTFKKHSQKLSDRVQQILVSHLKQHIVGGHRELITVEHESLHEQGEEVVRGHRVVFPSVAQFNPWSTNGHTNILTRVAFILYSLNLFS